MREQICFIVDLLRLNDNFHPLASFCEIGKIFHLSKGAISSHYSRGIDYKDIGRSNSLTDEQINEMIEFVCNEFSKNLPVSFDIILHFVKERFNIQFMIKTLENKEGLLVVG